MPTAPYKWLPSFGDRMRYKRHKSWLSRTQARKVLQEATEAAEQSPAALENEDLEPAFAFQRRDRRTLRSASL